MTHTVDSDSHWVLCSCQQSFWQQRSHLFPSARCLILEGLQFCKPKCSAHFSLIIADTPAWPRWLWRNRVCGHTYTHQVHDELVGFYFWLCNHVFLTASGAYLWQCVPLSGLWMFPRYWQKNHRHCCIFNKFMSSDKAWKTHRLVCDLPVNLIKNQGNKVVNVDIESFFKSFTGSLEPIPA